jgi:uncharacterized OB-fold protein
MPTRDGLVNAALSGIAGVRPARVCIDGAAVALTLHRGAPIQGAKAKPTESGVNGGTSGTAYFPPSRPWTEAGGAVRLHGSKCARCGVVAFPPHPMCPSCGEEHGQDTVALSGVGTLYTFCEIHIAPKGFATPYAVGYVDLPEGVRLFGQIEGEAAKLAVGQQVAVTLGPVRSDASGVTVISYKFKRLADGNAEGRT